jgi:hypothetical protein
MDAAAFNSVGNNQPLRIERPGTFMIANSLQPPVTVMDRVNGGLKV